MAARPEPPSPAVLSTLASHLDDLRNRVGAAAEALSASGDEHAAGEVYEIERSLFTAARRMHKIVAARR